MVPKYMSYLFFLNVTLSCHCYVHHSPWDGFCPVPLNTPVRLISHLSKKCIDFHWDDGRGSRKVHQIDVQKGNQNQKVRLYTSSSCMALTIIYSSFHVQWTIVRVGSTGFSIQHKPSGRFLAAGEQGSNGRFYMTTHELGSIFTFEPRPDGSS